MTPFIVPAPNAPLPQGDALPFPQVPNPLGLPQHVPSPSRRADNARTNAKRRLGTRVLDQRFVSRETPPATGGTPPGSAIPPTRAPAPPRPTPSGAPGPDQSAYRSPPKGLEYLAMGLALLFPGAPIATAAAGLLGGMQQGAQQRFQNVEQEREDRIAGLEQGYNLSTGEPTAAPPVPSSLMHLPAHPTTQDMVTHYNAVAAYYAKIGTPQAAQQAQIFEGLANAASSGYERITTGEYNVGARSNLANGEAAYYAGRNRTTLAAMDIRERGAVEMEGARIAATMNRAQYDRQTRLMIGTRAAILQREHWNAEAALRAAIVEYEQGQANGRNALSLGSDPGSVAAPAVNIYTGALQDPGVNAGAPVPATGTAPPAHRTGKMATNPQTHATLYEYSDGSWRPQ